MEPVIQKFRTALGGFNRHDVQRYIEECSMAHRQETDSLKMRLEESEARRAELEEALLGLELEKGNATEEGKRVRERLETSTKTLAKLRGEQSETESKLAVARRELERLRTRVAELEPTAARYEQLKERVATIELDAHRKAQGILDEAQADANKLHEETRQWLEGVMAQYSIVRRGIDALLSQAQALGMAAERTGELEEEAAHLKEQGGLE